MQIQEILQSLSNPKMFSCTNWPKLCWHGQPQLAGPNHGQFPFIFQLDMSAARRRLKSSRSLSCTSAHPTMVTLVNVMVMNGWPSSLSFHVNQPPHSWDKSYFRLWPWNSKVKIMGVVKGQGHTIGPVSYDRSISKFDLETSKVKVMSEVKGQDHILYPVSNQCTSFSFTSIRPTIPEIWPK